MENSVNIQDSIEVLIPGIKKIYSENEDIIEKQLDRYRQLIDWYHSKFEKEGLHFFSVPGRTEIGGNHTDHNNGRVLAASVDIDTIAVVSYNSSNQITLYSKGFEEVFKIDLNDLRKKENEKWTTSALIKGVAAGLKNRGYQVGGFNACISSEILPGSGLSSSASFEILIGSIFNALYNNENISAEELAKSGQFAENEFFGKPSGLMDQLACAVGGIIAIDFKKPDQPHIKKVDFDFSKEKYGLVVVNSGGSHEALTEDYSAIPQEMKAVAQLLLKNNLRDIQDPIIDHIKSIRHKLGDRAFLRAWHFIKENERVVEQVKALEENRFTDFLRIVNASGDSSFKWLQNVFSPAHYKDQGVTISLALSEDFIFKIGYGACRVHGGGFAGTIQTFIPDRFVKDYYVLIESAFGPKSAQVLNIRPCGAIYLNSICDE